MSSTEADPKILALRRREQHALHTLSGLPLPIRPLWEDFAPEVERVTELSISARLDSVGAMTRGLGRTFVDRILARLDAHLGARSGPEGDLLEQVLESSAKPSLFLKSEHGPAGLEELSWYFTEPRPAGEALQLLAAVDAEPEWIAALRRLLADLDAPSLYLGRSLPLQGRSRFAAYVAHEGARAGAPRRRLRNALRRLVPDPALRDLVWLHHDHLLRRPESRVFVSLGETPRGTAPVAKLDYEDVLRATAVAVLADCGASPEALRRLLGALDLLGMAGPGYLGLKLGATGPSCRLYLPRPPMILW